MASIPSNHINHLLWCFGLSQDMKTSSVKFISNSMTVLVKKPFSHNAFLKSFNFLSFYNTTINQWNDINFIHTV